MGCVIVVLAVLQRVVGIAILCVVMAIGVIVIVVGRDAGGTEQAPLRRKQIAKRKARGVGYESSAVAHERGLGAQPHRDDGHRLPQKGKMRRVQRDAVQILLGLCDRLHRRVRANQIAYPVGNDRVTRDDEGLWRALGLCARWVRKRQGCQRAQPLRTIGEKMAARGGAAVVFVSIHFLYSR